MYPIILLSVLGVVTLFLGFSKSKNVLLPAVLFFLVLAIASNFVEWNKGPLLYFYDMLRVDNLTLAFNGIVLLSAFMIVAISGGFQENPDSEPAEYFGLMLFSLVGALMMIGFEHMIMLFIGVEILSVAMYILTGSNKRNLRSNEAALKYFLMGAFATGFMLFGMTLIYGATGSFKLSHIHGFASNIQADAQPYILYAGLLLLLIGMLFKVSAAPFHFWTPDVYEGAPTIFTTFMSTIVKTAGFAALFRLLNTSFSEIYGFWWIIIATIAVLTLLVGNIGATSQNSFKRMLAYSGISHAGYMLIALTALTKPSQNAIVFYSLAYSLSTICAFGVLMLVSREKTLEGQPNERYEAFNGLAKQNPMLAFVLAVSMLSLAGIPLTAGFWGKFFIFTSAADRGIIWITVIAVLMSAVGIYYYFRVIISSYLKEGDLIKIRVAPFYQVILLLATFLTILFGLAPGVFEGLL
ncbi:MULTISPECIES: NADH-quinone oxidoreductase subunit N [Dyadobacter]|uniref:NADH-quinone oxidoreductase subunit N n=1 Tax=Dyadobacter chenhuakuii TaxID=2909339 RepID=A0A9X1QF32_9BACT|nr:MULTISPECIES: NADH-quinone oxidoreductase subunit N [Dyadobacter]MCF2495733.1 NADH-quinone oxidoreductase subunit N [Dyadobacter chenhuakuii]MCF2499814.1 NADH-quinone oxidoreductase subunit N [Dyadobacter chenhuakuii]MCF2520906.1 NADH-quinone oxidoreductase subunit N [Dyadobacter sp. CY351]USJ29764.1 NADH-quinone oxidoreductase subunit N [Dyadobacter chenhuakuii]